LHREKSGKSEFNQEKGVGKRAWHEAKKGERRKKILEKEATSTKKKTRFWNHKRGKKGPNRSRGGGSGGGPHCDTGDYHYRRGGFSTITN